MLLTMLLGTSSAAWACLIVTAGEFALDASAEDAQPPVLEEKDSSIRVTRGYGPFCAADGSISSSSCGDLGVIGVSISAAWDEAAPELVEDGTLQIQAGVGYRLRVVSGTPPDGFWLPEAPQGAFWSSGNASFSLVWGDGATDEQEPFAFELGIRAVDLAGNESSEELILTISDPGTRAEDGSCWGVLGDGAEADGGKSLGCAAAGRQGLLLALLGGLLGLGRRR